MTELLATLVRLRTAAVRMLCVSALAAGSTACVNTQGTVGHREDGDAAAVLSRLEREMEASLVNGRAYTLTELEGMTAAHALGAEGDDAAALWDDEIQRHYRSRRGVMARALEAEVDNDGGARFEGAEDERGRQAHGFFNSETYRRADLAAICASMASTPRAWSSRYPRRAPFSFRRFGIDEPAIARWCAASDRD